MSSHSAISAVLSHMSNQWRDDKSSSWYRSRWTDWQEWSDGSDSHDGKSEWSIPDYETPANDVSRGRPGIPAWTKARLARQVILKTRDEASGSNYAEPDIIESLKLGDVYWCDQMPKLHMGVLLASFHQYTALTGNLYECIDKVEANWATFKKTVIFDKAKDVYFPGSEPKECGHWKKLSVPEVHLRSHSSVLRMITSDTPTVASPAICTAKSNDGLALIGLASREFERNNTGPNGFSSTEIWDLVNNPSPALEEGDKMIFKNLAQVPNYTEDEEVVTLYQTILLSRLSYIVRHGLITAFGMGCPDISAVYGCPVPLAYASKIEPVWFSTAQHECTLVSIASENKAILKRDNIRGFINPDNDLYIKQIICKPLIKSACRPKVETDKDVPIYCTKCELWTNGLEQWEDHKAGPLHSPTPQPKVKVTSGNNDVEPGDASRASNDADATGQQTSKIVHSENVRQGETNYGEAWHNTETQDPASQAAHIASMLNVSNESREKNSDNHPLESLNPWLPRGKVQAIGSFTMFVFTHFKDEMWVLVHKLKKNADHGAIIVCEGGSIGLKAGKAMKKTMRGDIVADAELARMHLDRSAAPFLEWQLSKSTGHYLTKKARRSVVLRSSHHDSYYGDNSRVHYTYYTKCGDASPDLPHLASCKGEGYERGWAFQPAYQKKAAQNEIWACDNETHAWWKAKDLFRDISEDTTQTHFHESMYEIGELASRDVKSGRPGWQDHTKGETDLLIWWDTGIIAMLSNEERSCAEAMHANYHEYGNIHGHAQLRATETMPKMPKRNALQFSSDIKGNCQHTQVQEASSSAATFESFLSAAGVASEHTIIDARNEADIIRSEVLRVATGATAFDDIIPDGWLQVNDVLNTPMTNGCPPMTKMLMALFIEKGQHPYQHMTGLNRKIRMALQEMMHRHPMHNGSDVPEDEILQGKTLFEISEMNIIRWLIRYPLQAVNQDWTRINAHLIRLNVPLFITTGQVQWLDGANVRPNGMSPNSFPWRYSLAARQWEVKSHTLPAARQPTEVDRRSTCNVKMGAISDRQ